MRAAHAALLADAVAETVFGPVEVRGPGVGDAWRTVQGEVRRGSAVQGFSGFATQTVVGDDEVRLLASDFRDGFPTTDWYVRELEGQTAGRVLRLAEPARVSSAPGQFLRAPLKPNSGVVPE